MPVPTIGMHIDLTYLRQILVIVAMPVAVVFAVNTLIHAVALHLAEHDWRMSFYGGALLLQIGEFSFVLAAVGLKNDMITNDACRMTIAVICLSLLLSPAWIALVRRLVNIDDRRQPQPDSRSEVAAP